MSAPWVQIDGSRGEGGGQVLRTSLALSLLTGRPVQIQHIRAKRKKPGLQPQHRMSVRAAATVGQAEVQGDAIGSQSLRFVPGEVVAGDYHFPIGTAGATGLVLHTIYLPLLLRGQGPSTITVTGGTHNDNSPCFHFLDVTWRAYLHLLGLDVKLKMRRPGFYPRGGGVLEAALQPATQVRPLRMIQGPPHEDGYSVSGFSAVASLPESIAQRQAERAIARLERAKIQTEIRNESWPGGPGTVLALTLHGGPVPALFFGLGARGKPAERVADEAVDALLAHYHAGPGTVDPHSADQLLLPLVMAQGESRFAVSNVTQHLLTNVEVIRHFVGRSITVTGDLDEVGEVVIGPE